MGRFVTMLERRFGRYAIPRLPLYMVIGYAIGYVIQLVQPSMIYALTLNPYAILHGQVWRLVSWVIIPPSSLDIFTLVMLYCFYSIGMGLERTWGTFYFNYYVFSGMLYTLIGAFCMYGYLAIFQPAALADASLPWIYGGNGQMAYYSKLFSTYYVYMSILLAFAATYPDTQFLFMFLIPIKAKVLGVCYVVILAVQAWQMCSQSGTPLGLFVIGASLLNFVVFFLTTRKGALRSPAQRMRQRDFQRRMRGAQQSRTIAKHKCAICGRTSEDYPTLEFRFCSKCEGNYEFCQEHLFTHRHFKRSGG